MNRYIIRKNGDFPGNKALYLIRNPATTTGACFTTDAARAKAFATEAKAAAWIAKNDIKETTIVARDI